MSPDLLELATLLRETFGPLRITGPGVGKPEPAWFAWPSVKLSEMAEGMPERKSTQSRRGK